MGANSTIVCGVTIGKYAFVGAGAVVIRDIPDFALALGVPATIKGWMCACGTKLELGTDPFSIEKTECKKCRKKYEKEGMAIRENIGE